MAASLRLSLSLVFAATTSAPAIAASFAAPVAPALTSASASASTPAPAFVSAPVGGASGRLLFRTWPYMNPAANESVSFRALDLSVSPPALSTLATLPPLPSGETEISLYTGGSALDAAAGLWYSSTFIGGSAGFPPGRAVLTVFDVAANTVVRRVNASTYCNALFVDRGTLFCEAAAPWFWPPGSPPHSNDDIEDLVESLLSLDPVSGAATFLANFTPGFVLSYGSPVFDAASGTLYLHTVHGLSADIEVWSIDVRAAPAPRVTSRAAGATALQTIAVPPKAHEPGQLLAVVFERAAAPANYSLSLYSADVRGAAVTLKPVGSSGGSIYPTVSYTGGAATISGDGALLYAVGTSPERAPVLVSFDTATGAVAKVLDLSEVCPNDPSPCVIGDLIFSAV